MIQGKNVRTSTRTAVAAKVGERPKPFTAHENAKQAFTATLLICCVPFQAQRKGAKLRYQISNSWPAAWRGTVSHPYDLKQRVCQTSALIKEANAKRSKVESLAYTVFQLTHARPTRDQRKT